MRRSTGDAAYSSLLRRVKLRLVSVWLRSRRRLRDVRSDRRLVLTLWLAVVLLVVLLLGRTTPPSSDLGYLLEQAGRFLGVLLGAFVSLELFEGNAIAVDRKRLNAPEDVVANYEDAGCSDDFVGTASFLPEGFPHVDGIPDRLPVVPAARPEEPVPVDELDVCLHGDRYYPLPDRFEELLGPFLDRFAEEFVDEGHFNRMKARPFAIEGRRLELGRTTFFNNFVANLSADYDVFQSRTPRELLHAEVFDADGSLKGLADTDMPYIAASSGLILSRSGETVLPIRSGGVVIQGQMLGESFGGSWDWDVLASRGVDEQIREEFASERVESRELEAAFFHLGTMRRVDLMGKPDNYVLGYVDGYPEWREDSNEHVYPVVTRVVPEGETLDGFDDILDRHEEIVACVLGVIHDSPYRPTVGLLTWLWLFDQHGRARRRRRGEV